MCPFGKEKNCRIQKKGFFAKRSTRAARIQRYRCVDCQRSFSSQTGRPPSSPDGGAVRANLLGQL